MKLEPEKKQPLILYTIGYATKPIDVFIGQLKKYSINVVADIRSVPYSKVFHAYHKESIAAHLRSNHIRYVYLGEELGPRSKDEAHYDETHQVQFDRLMTSSLFHSGVDRLCSGFEKGFSIALMCAEKDPATCHRSLLVGYFLQHFSSLFEGENKILHIKHDGGLETQENLEERLSEINDIKVDLFMTEQEQAKQAYKLQCQKTSYRKDDV